MKRHDIREHIVFALYQHLLLNKDLHLCFEDNFEQISNNKYALNILNDLDHNIEKYKENINNLLVNWTFDRLNLIDQAILLVAVSELNIKETSKAIIIDEAILISKEYSEEEAYKYINGVLDKYE